MRAMRVEGGERNGADEKGARSAKAWLPGGLAGWVLSRLGGGGCTRPRLTLVERISLGPRQQLALVEAEGRRLLVATSAEGGPAFYALDERPRNKGMRESAPKQARVSW